MTKLFKLFDCKLVNIYKLKKIIFEMEKNNYFGALFMHHKMGNGMRISETQKNIENKIQFSFFFENFFFLVF